MTGLPGVLLLLAGVCLWIGVSVLLIRREVRRQRRRSPAGRPPPHQPPLVAEEVADEAERWLRQQQ